MTPDFAKMAREFGEVLSGSKAPYTELHLIEEFARAAYVAGMESAAVICDRRYMGDNNREDMEARRCAAAIRSEAASVGGGE